MATSGFGRSVKTRGRGVNIALWTAQILLGAAFALAGINKLLGLQQEMVAAFAKIGFGTWFRYLTGCLELAGGVGLLVPRLSGIAAIELAGVMVGAVLTHVFFLPPVAIAVVPGTLAVVFGLIAWGRWSRTRTLLGKFLPCETPASRAGFAAPSENVA